MDTFIEKYKPYFLSDFHFSDKFNLIVNDFLELDYLNILFIGDAGSGKTSLLNTMIREYYGLNKDQSISHSNVLFINNLKDQGIQFFRNEMKTFCQSHGTIYGKKKMVIIDDIDCINDQSQQVFRNYIDKYKHRVNFLCVCSNIQKVIESLQSRLHLIKLETPTHNDMNKILQKIITTERLTIDEYSQQYILQISQHSIRCLLNHLEKIYIYNTPITKENCNAVCSTMPNHYFKNYIELLQQGSMTDAYNVLFHLHDQGYSVIDIIDSFFFFIKLTDLFDEHTKYKIIPNLCKYITIFHNTHEHPLELALFTNNISSLFL